ncbi:hypothetical protein KP509_37G052300 [Ceratopteris richardii]|uniref:Uncharacterized protein n=1 Tax=Ceratopteris richardii TaxID=49495 RepID=A0A8T2Q8Z0_CERRI|nr:hypothetical protein KP509_37G052300 [Ceratopteris richardii]
MCDRGTFECELIPTYSILIVKNFLCHLFYLTFPLYLLNVIYWSFYTMVPAGTPLNLISIRYSPLYPCNNTPEPLIILLTIRDAEFSCARQSKIWHFGRLGLKWKLSKKRA